MTCTLRIMRHRRAGRSPETLVDETKGSSGSSDVDEAGQTLLDAMASLTVDDMPALEELFIGWLVGGIQEVQHDGPATADDASQILGWLQLALMGCLGERPERQPSVTTEIAAYREAFVTGAHAFASRGEEGMQHFVVRLIPAVQGELDKGRGDLDSQLRGAYQWSMLGIASGYEDESGPAFWALQGIIGSLIGWSEIQ